MPEDTICALATPNGVSALGVIRVSGKETLSVVQKSFPSKDLKKQKSHTIHYGYFVEGTEIIDEVMLSLFFAPKSFTTEDSVEISFHGSPHVAGRILEILIKNGARIAKAGEFTLRAFLNGRIDLSQAEAIADVISSENEVSRKMAIRQLKGGITREIALLRRDLLNFISLVELELDFSEEDVEFADRAAIRRLIDKIEGKILSLIDSFRYGNAVKNGTLVAIIGRPNAGKSTLLNTLLKEERAIVSSIAGTTRDTIEELLDIKGHAFRLIDTAGLRETSDEIEAIGVKKAKEKVERANILIYLVDVNTIDFSVDIEMLSSLLRKDIRIIVCATKTDGVSFSQSAFVEELFRKNISHDFSFIALSALENKNIDELIYELSSYVEKLKSEENTTVITNKRHYEALQKSLDAINKVKDALSSHIFTELLAYELRQVLEYLGEISGEVTNDEILGNIFSKFCIGK
ncbi:MAG: tRNA uridine-5-carboxymethylaminomethyl(34) synthesis GTPase MnmE [Bergeyella sp.]|nr:tRNA uridine-5-carboxymethylaminomethyl(34) synthesis GTPase MnmE [Bergeyella sp.]